MSGKSCPLFIVLSFFAVSVNAESFVNDILVPSDILENIFYSEIKNYPNLLNTPIPNAGVDDSSAKCIAAVQEIFQRLPALDVLPFLDSWGKLPSGILYGNLKAIGNFDQCVGTSVELSKSVGTVHGQYCHAAISPLGGLNMPPLKKSSREGMVQANVVKFIIGVCIPDICEPKFITSVLQSGAQNTSNASFMDIQLNNCVTAVRPDFEATNIVGIVIFSIIGGLMVLSTAYDVYVDYFKKSPIPILLAFSVITNGRKLFAINMTNLPNNIDCLMGIRVFSISWVLYCHNFLSLLNVMVNPIDVIAWYNSAKSNHIQQATVSVDTFLFMSGLLIAWIGFRELDKTEGRLNVLKMYLHRYLRLTPPVAAAILFNVSLLQYCGNGPLWNTADRSGSSCKKYWWSALLYVQNYVNPLESCLGQTWYLSVDTQLYIISPLILISLWKWGRKCAPVLVLLSLISIGCVIGEYYQQGYTQLMGLLGAEQHKHTYQPTHTRYSVWLIGVGLGYFMHKNRQKSIRPSKYVQLIGWIVCFVTILAIIYSPYFRTKSDQEVTVLEAGLYESLKRPAWGIALGWIVFACHFGFGGIVNSFLSHPFWQPLGRLTFCLYLVHTFIEDITFGSLRIESYFSDYNMILNFWSIFGISLMAAIVLSLAFEAPVLVIEKALLGGPRKTKIAMPVEVKPDIEQPEQRSA